MPRKKLSNVEVYDRISNAIEALGEDEAQAPYANHALRGARGMLLSFRMMMVRAMTPTADLWPARPKAKQE